MLLRQRKGVFVRPRIQVGNNFDVQTNLWASQVFTVTGVTPSNTQLTNVDTLIKAYKATSGLFALLSREWLFAAENAGCAKVDIIGLQSMTVNSAPTFTATGAGAAGYDGGGTGWIDTGFTSDANFAVNSSSFGASISTSNVTGAASKNAMGANSPNHYFNPLNATSKIEIEFGGGTFPNTTNLNGNHRGVYLFNYTGSPNVDVYLDNRTAITLNAGTQVLPTKSFFVCGQNDAFNALTNAYVGKISSAFFGGGMSSAQAIAKNAALAAYIAAVGA